MKAVLTFSERIPVFQSTLSYYICLNCWRKSGGLFLSQWNLVLPLSKIKMFTTDLGEKRKRGEYQNLQSWFLVCQACWKFYWCCLVFLRFCSLLVLQQIKIWNMQCGRISGWRPECMLRGKFIAVSGKDVCLSFCTAIKYTTETLYEGKIIVSLKKKKTTKTVMSSDISIKL